MTTIFFGRCRLIHVGHLSLFDQCTHIYFSETSRETESAETARALGYSNVDYCRTVIDALRHHDSDGSITLVVGEDRVSMRTLERSFPDLTVRVIPRDSSAPSSTACRKAIRNSQSLVELGLVRDETHEALAIDQYYLDSDNN